MSDITDDTDDLLVIPPDSFTTNDLIDSYEEGPYLNIVDTLIKQVSCLEDRVRDIEHSDNASTMNNSTEQIRSNFSTPQKPRTKYSRHSLPSTPSSSDHRQREMLRDIDHFVHNGVPKKKLEFSSDVLEIDGRVINLKAIEDLLRDVEVNKARNEERLASKEEELMTKTDTWKCGCGTDEPSSESSQSTALRVYTPTKTDLIPTHDKLDDLPTVRLMSLKDLWGKNDENFKLKLEEEKLRREHCEEEIKKLQKQSLELQERLAVALEVDQTKDNALLKFHDAWEQVALRIASLTKERDELERDLRELEIKGCQDLAETAKKIARYEEEASKALNLAHCNQQKIVTFEESNSELNMKCNEMGSKMQQLDAELKAERAKNQQLNEIIVQKELEIKNSKSIMEDSRKEVSKSKKAIDICQEEFTVMKTQYAQLESLLNDKEARIKELEAQKRNLLADNDNLKTLYKTVQDEVTKLEKGKGELRNYYQQQVELVVRDKMKEFQTQLDKAEEEIKSRELTIAKTAATHIQQLTEKHALEVNLLEEKHKEEVRLFQVQLTQTQQQIQHLQTRLKTMNDRRSQLAQQLHKVMEVQWLEAMKIINQTKSPAATQETTLNQLYSLQSKSYSNLEEVLSDNNDNEQRIVGETPRTSKSRDNEHIQKYVQMLLVKPAPTLCAEPTSTVSSHTLKVAYDDENNDELKSKSRRFKPPWK